MNGQQVGFARAGEIGRAAKDWATTDTGATTLGVAGGIFLGEWVGSWIVTQFAIEDGWTKVVAKAVAKAGLSFGLYFIGRKTGGVPQLLLNGAAIGSLASVIGDLVGEFVAPGLAGLVPGGSRNINIKAANKNPPSNVGNRNTVITTV